MYSKFFVILLSAGLCLNFLGMSCSDPLEDVIIEDVGDQKGVFAKDFKSKDDKKVSTLSNEGKSETGDTSEDKDLDDFFKDI